MLIDSQTIVFNKNILIGELRPDYGIINNYEKLYYLLCLICTENDCIIPISWIVSPREIDIAKEQKRRKIVII